MPVAAHFRRSGSGAKLAANSVDKEGPDPMAQRKPLSKPAFPDMQPIEGVALATVECGVAYSGRTDLMLVELQPGTQIAGVFTRSLTASAPVKWCREILPGGTARAIVVNAAMPMLSPDGPVTESSGRPPSAPRRLSAAASARCSLLRPALSDRPFRPS